MGRYKSQNPHKKKLYHKKQARTKRRKRDIDQIHNDILAFNNQINVQYDLSLPGGGQFYCVNCARHFVDSITLNMHKKSKVHKQKTKYLIKNPLYDQKEAESAAGLGKYTPKIKLK